MTCKFCGCSDLDPCVIDGVPCYWARVEVCDVCDYWLSAAVELFGFEPSPELYESRILFGLDRMAATLEPFGLAPAIATGPGKAT